MVVVRLKPFRDILSLLEGYKKICIFGCELGSKRCHNGGLHEAKALADELSKEGFEIVSLKSLAGSCILKNVVRLDFSNCDAVLSLSCGAGTQVIAENCNVAVVSGVDTLFIGAEKDDSFYEYCTACGDCSLSETGGICPIARCPKGLLNGPCGGCVNGMCEVNPDMPCVWCQIYERMKKLGKLGKLEEFRGFKDYSKSIHPRHMD